MKTLRIRVSDELLTAIDRAAASAGVPANDFLCGALRRAAAVEKLQREIQAGRKRCACGSALRYRGVCHPVNQALREAHEDGHSSEEAIAFVRTFCEGCGQWAVWDDSGQDLIDVGPRIGQEVNWKESP